MILTSNLGGIAGALNVTLKCKSAPQLRSGIPAQLLDNDLFYLDVSKESQMSILLAEVSFGVKEMSFAAFVFIAFDKVGSEKLGEIIEQFLGDY
jgi:hypothetical protein